MGINYFLTRYILGTLEDKLKGEHAISRLSFLEQAQWWPSDKQETYRLNRLQQLLEHAYANVPFYRNAWDNLHISPSEIKKLGDLERLPILSREDLRQHADSALRSTKHDVSRFLKGSSSGSSGDPVTFYKDQYTMSAQRAAMLAGWQMAGRRLGDKIVVVWGNYNTVRHEWGRLSSRIKATLYRETRIPAFQLTTAEAMERALKTLLTTDASILIGYTNALYSFALAAQERNLQRAVPFVAVQTTAETLTPQARQVIENVFGPVIDGYGCGEILSVAFQCRERQGYHIVEPDVIVEFEDIGLGSEKSLILTDLNNYAMPLIRYRVGDVGIDGNGICPCGRSWRTLRAIRGRINDIITTPQGGKLLIPSVFGSSSLKQVSGIAQYQLAIISDDKALVRIVPTIEFDTKDIDIIRRSLEPFLAGIFKYDVILVDYIPIGPSGKHKIIVDERVSGREFQRVLEI